MPDDVYTHGHHDSVLRSHRWRTLENSGAYLRPLLAKGKSALDVGCGPGTLTSDLARALAPGRVVGVDRSEGIVEDARRIGDGAANLTFEVGDVYSLPYQAGQFDLVHAHQVLQHLSDPVSALREMLRVCRSGGHVAVRDADYSTMAWWPPLDGLDQWMEMYQAVARANRAEPDAGRRLLGWAQAAGATEVVPSASVWCFADETDRTWWGDLWADRVVSSGLAEQAVAYGAADTDQLEEMAYAWRRWAGAEDGWFVVVHGEVVIEAQ